MDALAILEERKREWEELLDSLEPDKREQEERLYEEMAELDCAPSCARDVMINLQVDINKLKTKAIAARKQGPREGEASENKLRVGLQNTQEMKAKPKPFSIQRGFNRVARLLERIKRKKKKKEMWDLNALRSVFQEGLEYLEDIMFNEMIEREVGTFNSANPMHLVIRDTAIALHTSKGLQIIKVKAVDDLTNRSHGSKELN
uniref:Protein GrpE n=1 Tax=Syphacia muris TaxID=451379 RepID=A0A0N5B0C0_9BILA